MQPLKMTNIKEVWDVSVHLHLLEDYGFVFEKARISCIIALCPGHHKGATFQVS